jgi:hypothetical protein
MPKKLVLKTKTFTKWMGKCKIQDCDLLRAIDEMEQGLIDADLGFNTYKKRIGLTGTGKRSGARVIVATQLIKRWFFIYGFAKNEKSNVSRNELAYLQEVSKRLLNLTDGEIDLAIKSNELREIEHAD